VRFKDIRRTVLKTGEPEPWVLAVVADLTGEDHPGEIPATPRMVALDPLSPERPWPTENRASRRGYRDVTKVEASRELKKIRGK